MYGFHMYTFFLKVEYYLKEFYFFIKTFRKSMKKWLVIFLFYVLQVYSFESVEINQGNFIFSNESGKAEIESVFCFSSLLSEMKEPPFSQEDFKNEIFDPLGMKESFIDGSVLKTTMKDLAIFLAAEMGMVNTVLYKFMQQNLSGWECRMIDGDRYYFYQDRNLQIFFSPEIQKGSLIVF